MTRCEFDSFLFDKIISNLSPHSLQEWDGVHIFYKDMRNMVLQSHRNFLLFKHSCTAQLTVFHNCHVSCNPLYQIKLANSTWNINLTLTILCISILARAAGCAGARTGDLVPTPSLVLGVTHHPKICFNASVCKPTDCSKLLKANLGKDNGQLWVRAEDCNILTNQLIASLLVNSSYNNSCTFSLTVNDGKLRFEIPSSVQSQM
jgi:hypothetical protein